MIARSDRSKGGVLRVSEQRCCSIRPRMRIDWLNGQRLSQILYYVHVLARQSLAGDEKLYFLWTVDAIATSKVQNPAVSAPASKIRS